jgi:arabinose-5-phosphate isomerase
MHATPQNLHTEQLSVDAVQMMDQRKINALLVTNQQGQLVGALNMHDLLNAKVV